MTDPTSIWHEAGGSPQKEMGIVRQVDYPFKTGSISDVKS